MTRRAATLAALLLACGSAGPLSDKSAVADVLDAMHARGGDLKSFTADVTQNQTDLVQDFSTTRRGRVQFQALPGGDARLHLVFDSKQKGTGPAVPERQEYLLENGWLTNRDGHAKSETRRQLVPLGEKVDLFRLDKGVFPLPVGQDKQQVLHLFKVDRMPADKDDPPHTIHLQLTPKPGTPFARQFQTVDFWVDTAQRMPVRIETVDSQNVNDQTTDLLNLKVNPPVVPGDFALPPLPAGWTTADVPMGDPGARQ